MINILISNQAINQTLGSICVTFPTKMKSYSRNVKHILIAQLDEQTKAKTSKLDLTVVEGCFQGLNLALEVRYPIRSNVLKGSSEKVQLL